MGNNYFKMIINDLQRLWGGLDIGQKFGLVTLMGITLVAVTFLVMKSTEPNWAVLYSDLTETDAVSVSESIKKSGYPVKVSKDKKAVLVPANMQDDLRLYVAQNDLIQDREHGFELLDDLQLGSTDFKNQLTKQRIFQGELTRSIERINGIAKARVQIAEPERSVFADRDEAPSASVILILQPGYRIKTEQVKAIKNLVAYAVPRLTPDRVFLTDQNGNSLTDEVGRNSGDIESYKLNIENQTAKKVQTVLEKIVGRGNVSVQVSADIDFNSARATIESYIPLDGKVEGVVTSQQTENEIYDNPNATSNITINNEKKNLNYTKQKNLTNYSVSKEIKQVVYAPGSIKRMTVAVAVNKILTSQEKQELNELVVMASGLDANRGDAVTISSMQFSGLAEEKVAKEAEDKEIQTASIIKLVLNDVAPIAVIFLLGVIAIVTFRSLFRGIVANATAYASQEDSYEHYPSIKDELGDLADIETLPQLEAKLDPELERIKSDLNETILNDTAEATRLLISYIKD